MIRGIWTGMYAERPLDEAIGILTGHGWRAFEASTEHLVAIEQCETPDDLIDSAKRALADVSAVMPQAHALLGADVAQADGVQREHDIARVERHLEFAASLGVEVVVLHPGGRTAPESVAEYRRIRDANIESLRRLCARATSLGVRIALENLMRRTAATAYEMIDLVDRVGDDRLGITLDTSHANVMGLDIPTMIAEFGELLIATHISDNDGTGDQHRTPGNARIEWLPVMEALGVAGYERLLNLEIPGERDEVPALRELKSRHAEAVSSWLVQQV